MIASALRLSSRRPSIAAAVLTRRTTAVIKNNKACVPTIRYFSTNEDKTPKRDSLRDAVNRIKSDSKEEGATTDSTNSAESSATASTNNIFRQLASTWDTFRAELDLGGEEGHVCDAGLHVGALHRRLACQHMGARVVGWRLGGFYKGWCAWGG